MRNNNHKGRRTATGRPVGNPTAPSPVHTPEQRETLRQGLRILAKIIALAHLQRRAASHRAAPGNGSRDRPGMSALESWGQGEE